MAGIDPRAVVDPDAELAEEVEVGPYAVIGPKVRIGRGTRIGAHAVIEGETEIGERCRIFPFAAIGTPPQDLSYRGEPTRLSIGSGNTFREYVTVHRGTARGGGETRIGNGNLFMAYVHVAHDCRIGDHVVMANAATLGGHIEIGDNAVVGGLVGVHQFCRIGAYSMIGGCSAVAQDIAPFVRVAGNRARLFGLNLVGLRRNGFSDERIIAIRHAYRLLFRAGMPLKEAVKKIRDELGPSEDVEILLSFMEGDSKRGICR